LVVEKSPVDYARRTSRGKKARPDAMRDLNLSKLYSDAAGSVAAR
jgi:hypothetical protein